MNLSGRLAAIERRAKPQTHRKVVIYSPTTQPRPDVDDDTFVIALVPAGDREVAAVALPHNFREPLWGEG